MVLTLTEVGDHGGEAGGGEEGVVARLVVLVVLQTVLCATAVLCRHWNTGG